MGPFQEEAERPLNPPIHLRETLWIGVFWPLKGVVIKTLPLQTVFRRTMFLSGE